MKITSLRLKAAIPLIASIAVIISATAVHAVMYAPGATLAPACGPTDPDCGVTSSITQTPWNGNITAAGHTLYGNSTASGSLTLDSTSHTTKGYVLLNPAGGNVGIGTSAPQHQLELTDVVYARNVGDGDLSGVDIFGREYLYAFTHKLMTSGTPVIVLAGDSTTAGSGISDTNYLPQNLLKRMITRDYTDVTIYNDAVSGSNTKNWRNSYLANQLARNPDMMIVRYGINDGATNRTDFETDLRASLAQIRAARPVDQTAIVLMTPTSTNDTPNGRDDAWYKIAVPIIRKAARDYQCTYIDTYTAFRDATNATAWMDDPFGDGRHIHPLESENLAIANLISEVIYPSGTRKVISGTIVDAAGKVGIGTGSTIPTARLQILGTAGGTMFFDSNQISMNRNPNTGAVIDATKGASSIVMLTSGSGSNFQFWTNNTTGGGMVERLRIAEGGNVGIGTNSPSYKLDVNGVARVTGRLLETQGAAVASTNDLVLGNDGNFFRIAGDAQVNAIATSGWTAGSRITLVFNAGAIMKNNTAGGAGTVPMLLSGGADFTASANDVLTLIYDGTNWLEVSRSIN